MAMDTDWIEVIVPVAAAEVDDLAAMIVAEVPEAEAGIEIRGDEIVFWTSVARSEQALAHVRACAESWAAGGATIEAARVRLASARPEAEWRDAWKRYFKVTHITRQFVVVPSWEAYQPQVGELALHLDPGMAFGTGTHASTRLVMEELQTLADDVTFGDAGPERVLDVGAGSGILSIAAARRWPKARIIAVDNDPIAVKACAENAAANHVTAIASEITPCGDVPGAFPLILANIQAHVLRALKSDLLARLAPGGTLILSGLLTPQAQPIADEFAEAGAGISLTVVRVRPSTDDAQWSSVTLRREA